MNVPTHYKHLRCTNDGNWSSSMLEEFRRREIVRASREAEEARGPIVYDPPRRRKCRRLRDGDQER